jgi:alkaline phosphatase
MNTERERKMAFTLKNSFLIFLSLWLVLPISSWSEETETNKPRNIIIMISDGFGPTAVTAAREYWGKLNLDEILVGTVRTRSHSSAVTDSAAGATAFATGVRTYNRAVSVDPDKQPLTTLLKEAKKIGMATGLVATSSISHATPAAFSSHALHRKLMYDIAAQQAELGIDLLLGGGREDWLPLSDSGCRPDEKNLLEELVAKGYHQASYQKGVLNLSELPAIGLFAQANQDFVIDRDNNSGPTLPQMASKALSLLSKQPNGFFLMIEGSLIDHAGHINDPSTKLHEIKAYDDTVRLVLDFAQDNAQTLVVSVSDHETGGMSIGRRVGNVSYYNWRPEVLRGVTASSVTIARRIIAGADPLKTFSQYTGLTALNKKDRKRLIQLSKQAHTAKTPEAPCKGKWRKQELTQRLKHKKSKKFTPEKQLIYWIAERISREAHIGWTTYGHTGTDVFLYASGKAHEKFRGSHDNTEIATIIAQLMGFKQIQEQALRWNK